MHRSARLFPSVVSASCVFCVQILENHVNVAESCGVKVHEVQSRMFKELRRAEDILALLRDRDVNTPDSSLSVSAELLGRLALWQRSRGTDVITNCSSSTKRLDRSVFL